MIYQALLNKAATYPPEQYYKATAYKYAAESVLTQHDDLRYNHNIVNIPYIGSNITKFIEDFNNHPCSISFCSICEKTRPVTTSDDVDDVFASDGYKYATQAMNTAHSIAAMNAPKNTSWSSDDAKRDDAERIAFQARLAASKVQEVVLGTITDGEVRRSSRLQAKPKVNYNQDDDVDDDLEDDDETYIDDDDIDEEDYDDNRKAILTIKDVCSKKGWEYSDSLITEYKEWRQTITTPCYNTHKYNWYTGKYTTPRTEVDIAKRWATDVSDSLRKQKVRAILINAITKQCIKLGIQYEDTMYNKYIQWFRNPDNKKHFTRTIWLQTGNSYTYDLLYTSASCINKWIATLKKTIVW
jgi:hypothetical protein